MSKTHTLDLALKSGAAATGVSLLMWGVMMTPVGVLFLLLFGVFVAEPLDSLGIVDLGKSSNGFFAPNYVALALLVVPAWLFMYWLFFTLFKASAERAAGIDET